MMGNLFDMEMDTVLFVDGDCLLCVGVVSYLNFFDRRDLLKFGSLQGETAANARERGLFDDSLDSVIYVRDFEGPSEEVFTKSGSVIALGEDLGGVLHLLRLLKLFPRSFRDKLYDLIAQNRFRWFARRQPCTLSDNLKTKRLP